MTSSRQLVLDLPHRVALAREDFMVGPCNAAAVALIDSWPSWPSNAVVLMGPPGSGKSHLVEVWRQLSGAVRAEAAGLTSEEVPAVLRTGQLALEDVAEGTIDETALFHLLNLARQAGAQLLLTCATPPTGWTLKLPDLASRLRALPVVELGPADDDLLRGVLAKLFADRQLAVDDGVLSYLLTRMPRSFAAARRLVSEIDSRALAEKAEITRPFVARVMGALDAPGLFGEE
jgi:chromosomal replication initiation ATPase DnaA